MVNARILDEPIAGPLGRTAVFAFLVAGTLANFSAFPHTPAFDFLISLAPIGLLFLVPGATLRHAMISVPALLMAVWTALSISWTADLDRTTFLVRVELPYLIGFMICGALLSEVVAMRGLLWMSRIGVAISVLATIAIPSTRSQIQATGDLFEGWHAFFGHKNDFGPYLAFVFAIVLVVDLKPVTKYPTLLAIAILSVGSQSVTAMTTIFVILAVYAWLGVNKRADDRMLVAAVVASLALAIAGALGVRAGLPIFLEATGKDPTFSGRTDIWSAVVGAIREQPTLGYGRGGLFFQPANDRTVLLWRDIGFRPPHAHNGIIDLWSQLGLVGVTLYFWLFVSATRLLIASYRRGERFGSLGLLIVTSIAVASLSENMFVGPYLSILIFLQVIGLRLDRQAELSAIRESTTHDTTENGAPAGRGTDAADAGPMGTLVELRT